MARKKEPYDAGNEAHVKRRTLLLEDKEKREQEDLRKILDTYSGRAYLWKLMGLCRIFHSSYTGEAESTFFNEGKRSIGLEILTEVLTLHPRAFTLMQSEATARNKEYEEDA